MREMPEEQALEVFKMAIFSTDWLDENVADDKLDGLRRLWDDYSSKSEDVSILLPVYNLFKSVGATNDVLEKTFDRGALIKLSAVRDAEEFIEYLKGQQASQIGFSHLRKTIFKLATESYSSPLEKLLKQLLIGVSTNDLDTRQRSLRLSIEALQTLADGSFWEIRDAFIKAILSHVHMSNVGYEIVELIGKLIESAIELNRWIELKICTQTLRAMAEDTSDFKNKKALAQIEDIIESSVTTDILLDAVISGKGDIELHESLAALKSPHVVVAILDKIDHEDKSVRARVIKALITMGRAAGSDVTAMLAGLVGAGESNDDKTWYKLRNLIRVLGQVGYIEALPYFEVMAGWNQTRLKHEIITACEDLKSPATGIVLSKLAVDKSPEIRKAATIALGMSGFADMLKFINNLIYDPRSDKVLLVKALARIKGSRARNILIDLYEDEEYYNNLNIPKKDQEQIKLAILKALSKIGDDVAKCKIELYGSKYKGGFFKKDVLSETATILLKELKKQD
jgi:HEAT repeat protein